MYERSIPVRREISSYVARLSACSVARATSFCDLDSAGVSPRIRSWRLSVLQQADLSDGRRVLLKDDRGWSSWPLGWPQIRPGGSWKVPGGRALTKEAILILDPDDNESWMDWVVGRLRFLGLDVDPASVHAAPFHVEFGPRVLHELQEQSPEFSATGPLEDRRLLSVVALGAVCEIDYLTAPTRHPMFRDGGYAYYPTPNGYPSPEELGAAGLQPSKAVVSSKAVVYGSYYRECSPVSMSRWCGSRSWARV